MYKLNQRVVVLTAALCSVGLLAACNRDNDPDRISDAPVTNPAPDSTAGMSNNNNIGQPSTSPAPDSQVAQNNPNTSETVGQKLDDSVVTGKVKAALMARSDVQSSSINVETVGGKVNLTGSVPDRAQAERAVEIARGVEGVVEVNNGLTVGG